MVEGAMAQKAMNVTPRVEIGPHAQLPDCLTAVVTTALYTLNFAVRRRATFRPLCSRIDVTAPAEGELMLRLSYNDDEFVSLYTIRDAEPAIQIDYCAMGPIASSTSYEESSGPERKSMQVIRPVGDLADEKQCP